MVRASSSSKRIINQRFIIGFQRYNTWAKPVKTEDSKQRYSFDRHETVFSNGLYQVAYMSGLSLTYK
jgi:hypothetical protein